MKIIIDARTTQDEIKFNGVGRYSRFIIEYLIKSFPETKFILFLYDSPSTLDTFLKRKPHNVERISLGKYLEKGGLEMIKLNLDLVFHVSLNKALRKVKKEQGLKDAIFFSPYFWRGIPIGRVKSVVVVHDFALPYFNIYSTISPIHNIFRMVHYWLEFFNVFNTKAVIVDAKYTYDDFLNRFKFFNKNKLHEVLLGVEEDFGQNDFEKLLPDDWNERKYLLYLGGGVTKNKNSDGVIKGYKEFVDMLLSNGKKKSEIPYLVIAGKLFVDKTSKNALNLQKLVKNLEIEDMVCFTGMYSDFARWDLVKNSFAFIHLSTFEGFGFSVAEAMRSRVPVIVHNGTTYPEVVKDGGILVDGLNAKKVGEAIYKLYTDTTFAKKIANRGYMVSLNYDWNKTAKETFNIISKVIK